MKHLIVSVSAVLLAFLMGACGRQPMRVASVQTEVLLIDSTLDAIADSEYVAQLVPITKELNEQLDIVIGYAPEAMDVYAPESPLSNWGSDALLIPIREQYPETADLAIVNEGGLRCNWPAGDITYRKVFELMPFDNEVVILTLPGTALRQLTDEIAEQGGQGIAGMTMEIKAGKAQNVLIGGKPLDETKSYYVITSDYLSGGADGLNGLTLYTDRMYTGLKIRDVYTDYIKRLNGAGQPVTAKLDGRIRVVE